MRAVLKPILVFGMIVILTSCTKPVVSTEIVGWGDSMLKGSGGEKSILEVISKELKVSHQNFAVGGLRSSNIATLQGGLPLKITTEGGVIKADKITKLTFYSIEPINFQTEQTRTGSIQNIKGKLSRLSEKDNKKETVGYTFEASDLTKNTYVGDTMIFTFDDALQYRNYWTIIWAGRNDSKSGDAVFGTRDNIQAMLDYQEGNASSHCLILSVCNGNADREGKGTGAYKNITRLNTVLEKAFPDRFIDVRSYMVNKAIYDMNIDPTPQDIADMEKDAIPRRFLKDHVHFNTLGYEATGKYIARVIKERSWITEK